jgi:hypothetical protein
LNGIICLQISKNAKEFQSPIQFPLLGMAHLTSLNFSHFKMVEDNYRSTFLPNFMKIYQAVHTISTDSLQQKPAGRVVFSTANKLFTMVNIVALVIMVT